MSAASPCLLLQMQLPKSNMAISYSVYLMEKSCLWDTDGFNRNRDHPHETYFYPAFLECVEYIATTYECRSCKDSLEPQFIKDEGTSPLIPNSYVSSGLKTHVMYGKFISALLFYCQEKDFENQFYIRIGPETMAD